MYFDDGANKILDSIIETRRTVRSFKAEIPRKEIIEAIVHAGLWAPFARMAITREQDFRRFFIVENGNPILRQISELIKKQAEISLEHWERQIQEKTILREKAKNYLRIVKGLAERGYPELMTYPCLVIIGEEIGVPPVEQQSLAHVVENMWLKATALGIGLRVMSVIETLTESEGFSRLLGVDKGVYAFTGCILGYADQNPAAGTRPQDREITKWL
jgi:nitroreductase